MAIERVAVIGAGTMGAGIAQVCAQAGWTTALYDAFPEGLERGMQRIDAFWDKGIARGKTTAEQKEAWAKNLRAEADMKTAVHDVDLVIEAVPEIPELKAKVFAQLDEMAPEHAILGTNTSSLSIASIAAATDRPDKVIGMHFFNPVPIMELLELVRHATCSEETIALAQAAGEAMKKTTILVKDVPGFATSRLGVVLGNEAIRMLADGVASAEDIRQIGLEAAEFDDAIGEAAVLLVLNNHRFYRNLDIAKFVRQMPERPIIFDTWHIFEPDLILDSKPCTYMGLGFTRSSLDHTDP